jgi:tripartite-type tricarboxylate transporter receptor subunit TctC
MITTTRRRFAAWLALAAGGFPCRAFAAGWPERPVTIVVPFPAGGPSDIIARLFAEHLSESFGSPFVVENRPGANGNIGAALVARAAPDGYTLLLSGNGHNAMNHGVYARMPYDSRKDFAHICLLASTPNALVVAADYPAKNFGAFLEGARKPGDPLPFASPGIGSSGHLTMALLQRTAGLNLQHIPYRGAAPVIIDLVGKHVSVGILNVDVPLSHVRGGLLRVLAVTGAERSALYPDAPTVAEEGFSGFSAAGWFGLSAPAGTPREIIGRLLAALMRALQAPQVRERFAAGGYIAGGGTPETYAAFISSEIEKWTRVASEVGIAVE